MSKNFDFSGWVTRANRKCTDGRVIMDDAFAQDDGKVVPLVWMHNHSDATAVLGQVLLENRGDGVYGYGSFNDTESGKIGKQLVEHGDVTSLSICANSLIQKGPNVIHGAIKEVSLVLAGANDAAKIDNVIQHGELVEDEAIIFSGEGIVFSHADESEPEPESKPNTEKTVKDVIDSMTEEQKNVLYYLVGVASGEDVEDDEMEQDDDTLESFEHAEGGKTIKDVIDSMNEEQKKVLYALVGIASEDNDTNDEEEDNEMEQSEYLGGNTTMKHNVFDAATTYDTSGVLMHADGTPVMVTEIPVIFDDMKRYGSLKESCLAHGIEDIDWLFPDDRMLTNTPEFIKRDQEWVSVVMNGVHHTPFSRVKSMFADLTEDDARAKGYLKGKMKKEEFFSLIKRSTSPTTVYKKQKMDRDDMIDITGFDVVSWLKGEMRMMLNEELARAYLLGDGRLASSDDKINEQNIRPIAKDDDLFTIKVEVKVKSAATDSDKAKAFIYATLKQRKEYKGSGNPILFTTEDMLTDMLLLEDNIGRPLYADEAALARKLRVSRIVTVPPMESAKTADNKAIVGVLLNLNDYNVGADKGGAVNMFDDFDIDYNQQKYLIETRCSGALTVPYSAMTMYITVEG